MSKDNLQDNLKTFITAEVIDNERVFKIVDGTQPLKDAHVFLVGKVPNLGETDEDFRKMGIEAHKNYCDWYAENRNVIRKYYEEKENQL